MFGILAFAWPGVTLLTLVVFYGVYALFDGVFALIAAIRGGGVAPRWWLALVALASVAAGVIALLWPGITAIALVVVIGAAAIVRGVFEIIGAVQLRKTIDNEWFLGLSGAISVLFGMAILAAPGLGALTLVWLIAAWAILFGVLMVGLSLRLRKLNA